MICQVYSGSERTGTEYLSIETESRRDEKGKAPHFRDGGLRRGRNGYRREEESYTYEDAADGSYSCEYTMEGWDIQDAVGDRAEMRVDESEKGSMEYDKEGRLIVQSYTHTRKEDGEPAGESSYDIIFSYNERGDRIMQETKDDSRFFNDDGSVDESSDTYTYRYTYEYDEDGNILSRITETTYQRRKRQPQLPV